MAIARLLLLVCLLPLPCRVVRGQSPSSLWDRRDEAFVPVFHDTQAIRQGDLLTVLIAESTDVNNNEGRSMSRNSASGGGVNFSVGTGGDVAVKSAFGNLDTRTTAESSFEGAARFSSERGIADRITVEVVRVHPRGNLEIAGQRKIYVAGECRTLQVTGVVRSRDVRSDNTIQSRYVAGLKVSYIGRGFDSQYVRQGWMAQVVNKLWPF